MPITSAKCPSCGGDIKLDDTKKSGFCMYCGGQVIVEDAIALGKVKVEGNVRVEADVEKMVRNGLKFIELGEYQKAKEVFVGLYKEAPEDYRGWWGIVLAKTKNFTVSEFFNGRNDFEYRVSASDMPVSRERDNAIKLAPPDEAALMEQQYNTWYEKCLARRNTVARMNVIRKRIDNHKGIINSKKYDRKHAKKHFRRELAGLIFSIPFLASGIVWLVFNVFFNPTWWLLLIVPISATTIFGAIEGIKYGKHFAEHRIKARQCATEIQQEKEDLPKIKVELQQLEEYLKTLV